MIYVGCDHGGYQLKLDLLKYLEAKGFDFEDMGCNGETVDYPDIAEKVCRKVLENSENKGLLICGTGIGISIAANKIQMQCRRAQYTYMPILSDGGSGSGGNGSGTGSGTGNSPGISLSDGGNIDWND